jgi:hypothetical protein
MRTADVIQLSIKMQSPTILVGIRSVLYSYILYIIPVDESVEIQGELFLSYLYPLPHFFVSFVPPVPLSPFSHVPFLTLST